MDFPYGKTPLAILLIALAAGTGLFCAGGFSDPSDRRPDLVYATFTKEHAAMYGPAIKQFEKTHHCTIQLQLVEQRALQGRLESALQAGADVPDMVELLYNTLGFFTRGPLDDVQLLDLTDRVRKEGLDKTLVTSRFGQWSSRGHIFALPHDVHPAMLAYRRDLVEKLGIDVSRLTTWDAFCRVGREVVTKDLDGDGIPDRYMLDLPGDGSDILRLLMLQHGASVFAPSGDVGFDDEKTLDVVCWYVRQIEGKERIAFPCGWGQTLSRAMIDGLCLFYVCPDWRTKQIEVDIPSLAGKMAVMPLPAWEPGGLRTSTWGGTGLAITRQCRKPDLAWQLAMYLYYDRSHLGARYEATNILPPLKSAWDLPEMNRPRAFWSGQRIGQLYARLAPDVPVEQSSPYMTLAIGKLSEAFSNIAIYYNEHGDNGLRDYARSELHRCANRVRDVIGRNVFLKASHATRSTTSATLPPPPVLRGRAREGASSSPPPVLRGRAREGAGASATLASTAGGRR